MTTSYDVLMISQIWNVMTLYDFYSNTLSQVHNRQSQLMSQRPSEIQVIERSRAIEDRLRLPVLSPPRCESP
jgi:hypothetical protein